MRELNEREIRERVKESYANIANAESSCCAPSPEAPSCCGPQEPQSADDISTKLGYSKDDVSSVPEGANLGLGCGNPKAIASLKTGETVVDLGSGAGFDAFLASEGVGVEGSVIGVDMTPEMLSKARKNAEKAGFTNVEFRLGEIENLPVANNTADVLISNCVINLSPSKPRVFREAFRILKSGGRLAIADIVAIKELPEHLRDDMALYSGCIAGAATKDELSEMLTEAGFTDLSIKPVAGAGEVFDKTMPGVDLGEFIVSAYIEAVKP